MEQQEWEEPEGRTRLERGRKGIDRVEMFSKGERGRPETNLARRGRIINHVSSFDF